MKRSFVSLAAAMLLATCGGAAVAAEQGVTDAEILVGDVNPYTGPPALLGAAFASGLRMSFAEVNAAGGIANRKLRLIGEDDGYVTSRTISSLRKLADVDKVFAITGVSGAAQSTAAMPILEKIGLPVLIGVAPMPVQFDPPKKNIFVVGQLYKEGFRQLALFLAEKNPGKKFAIISQDDDYGLAARDGYDEAAKEKKINTVFTAIYKKGQTDFSSEILRLKESGAEVFVAGGIISENVAMLKELEKVAFKPVTGIFWVGRVEAVLKLAGPASDGIYAVDYVPPLGSDAGKAFVEKARKFLPEGEAKGVNRYTQAGYGVGRVLIEALQRCAKDLTRECALKELENTKNLDTGAMTPITFGPGKRFSDAKVQIMQADYSTLSFKPVQ